VPHKLAKFFSAYSKMVLSEILGSLYTPHPVPVCIYINEFGALGRIEAMDGLGIAAGSGIQLVVVVQSLVQCNRP
jgi:type IV secretory pathway TraG/TraD family ATPase VirD4